MIADRVPPGQPILVWGWRPEIYLAAERPPATRYVGGVTARKRDALLDLGTLTPPAAVVLPGEHGVGGAAPFALERHPELEAWLLDAGYVRTPPEHLAGYTVWWRPDLAP